MGGSYLKYTEKFRLRKPDNEDFYDVADSNYNADVVDEALRGLKTASERHSDELGDSHIGWDGTEYQTTGDAVRGQAADLNNRSELLFSASTADILAAYGRFEDTTRNGITFAWSGTNCTISGSATAYTFCNVLGRTDAMPKTVRPGDSFDVVVSGFCAGVTIRIYFYPSDAVSPNSVDFGSNGRFTVPDGCTGMLVRISVPNGTILTAPITVSAQIRRRINNGDVAYDVDNVATVLSSGSDYNEIRTPGSYQVRNSTTAKTMINCPISYGHRLEVFSVYTSGGEATLRQLVVSGYSGAPYTYDRTYSGGNWSAWRRIATQDDISSAADAAVVAANAAQLDNLPSATNGHCHALRPIRYVSGRPYIETAGTITENPNVSLRLSDFILCPRYVWVTIPKGSTGYIYFYRLVDGAYQPDWNLLQITDPNGTLNRITMDRSRNRLIDTGADDCYVRMTDAVQLIGWDGVPFGPTLAGDFSCPYFSVAYDTPLETGMHDRRRTGFIVPGTASAVMTLSNSVLSYIYGVRHEGGKVVKTQVLNSANDGSVQYLNLPTGFEYFRVRLAVLASPISSTSTDVSVREMSIHHALDGYAMCASAASMVQAAGRGAMNIATGRKILDMEWSPVKTVRSILSDKSHEGDDTDNGKFVANVTYTGVPYGSNWAYARYLGWHVSKHTFLNAVNDGDSIFYKERSGYNDGNSYGLVCSAFATLCCGFPYPMTNAGMSIHPDVAMQWTESPVLGAVNSNMQLGHCYVPESVIQGDGWSAYSVMESVGPTTGLTMCYSFIPLRAESVVPTFTHNASYGHRFRRVFAYTNEKAWNPSIPYDIENGIVTGGSVRPYKGDRCVYTSDEAVRINIKNADAATLLVRRYEMDEDGDLHQTADTFSVPIGVASYIDLDKSMLQDGGFYGVSTDMDQTAEYFEYHDVSAVRSYTVSDGNIVFTGTGEFWYAYMSPNDRDDETVSEAPYFIGYEDDGNYRRYTAYEGGPSKNGYVFYRGRFGAYRATIRKV